MIPNNIFSHETHSITEGYTFTFVIYGCDKQGFSGIRDWVRSNTGDYIILGYTDDEFSMPQDIRGFYAMATSSSLSNFQNTIISAIYAGGGLYSRISCEMDQLDFETALTWCRQLPHTCEIGGKPRTWSGDISTMLSKEQQCAEISSTVEPVNEIEKQKTQKFTFNCSWCNDCDIDLHINR